MTASSKECADNHVFFLNKTVKIKTGSDFIRSQDWMYKIFVHFLQSDESTITFN